MPDVLGTAYFRIGAAPDGRCVASCRLGLVVPVYRGDAVDIPYTVTEPGFRSLWVTPAMWQRTAVELIGAGYHTVTYSTNSQQFRSMFNFTRRLGSRELGRQVRYARHLTAR